MNKKAALVLSGGAARGIAHIGVIEELTKQGFKITSIAGNSMGAFIGAVFVMNKIEEFKERILALDKKDVLKFIDFSFGKQGFIKGEKIFKELQNFFPDTDIENLKIPYAAVAADIKNMKEVVFTEGSLYKAVRASISIPSIFKPVKTDNAVLVDGGVVNPIPVNRITRTKNDILIASYVNANIPYSKPSIPDQHYKQKSVDFNKKFKELLSKRENKDKLNYFSLLSKSTNLLTHRLSIMNIEKYKPDLLIETSRETAGLFDFFKAKELIEAGKKATIKALSDNNTLS